MFVLPDKIIEEEKHFQEALDRYLKGEITDNFFRGIRVPWGFYSQRGSKKLMCRVRIPGGVIGPKKLSILGELSEKFGSGKLHLTTRQDIQIHDIEYENAGKILSLLHKNGMSSRGGGGNTIRNITACPNSGLCQNEKFPAYKLATFLSGYLLSLPLAITLPRKIKIAISGCDRDCAFTGVNDIGIVAIENQSFKVIVGGGMGAKSKVGYLLENSLNVDEILRSILAIVRVYNLEGDRKNRHRNRLRFLIEDKGFEWFKTRYLEEKELISRDEFNLNLKVSAHVYESLKDESQNIKNDYFEYSAFQQKDGNYYILLRIPLGNLDASVAKRLAELETFFPNIYFKVTQRQNLIITNLEKKEVLDIHGKLKEIFDDFYYADTILDVQTCKGATTCNLGLGNAPGLGKAIIKVLEEAKISYEKWRGFKINISGCPNACGQHPIGTLGMYGSVRKIEGRSVLFYNILAFGKNDGEKTLLAHPFGLIPAKNIPLFIKEMVSILDVFSTPLKAFEEKGREILNVLIDKYSKVPSYEENIDFYKDFEKEEEFSLQGLSQGECGAGIIDMIESDLVQAQTARTPLEKILYSARSLLVLKGIDVIDFDDAVKDFVKYLVDGGVFPKKYKNLPEFVNSIKNGLVSHELAKEYANELLEEVKEVYRNIDSSFNLPVRYEVLKETENEKIFEVYDLRGVPCPINFVKAKLKLEEMKIGDTLMLYLDEGEPIKNVPLSLKEEGHKIVSIERKNEYYEVLVKKGE
jgi:sulfite reductase (ferredoxin)